MGMLDGLVGELARNALGNAVERNAPGGLGGVLGGLIRGSQAGAAPSSMNTGAQGGLGGLGGLGGVLGSILGGGAGAGGGGGFPQAVPQQTPTSGAQQGGLGGMLGGNNQLLIMLLPVLLAWIQQHGGISAVLGKLTGAGMGTQANSWISQGANQPVPADQVSALFNPSDIAQMANQFGASHGEVQNAIATLLPQVINSLTPSGDLSQESDANSEITQVLQQLQQTFN